MHLLCGGACILRRIEEDKAANLVEVARVAKAGKGKGKAEYESSSHGGSEVQVTEGVAGKSLPATTLPGLMPWPQRQQSFRRRRLARWQGSKRWSDWRRGLKPPSQSLTSAPIGALVIGGQQSPIQRQSPRG